VIQHAHAVLGWCNEESGVPGRELDV